MPLLILMSLTSRTIGDPDLPPCSTDETTVIQQLPGWDYLGCYRDEMSTRLLSKYYYSSENMTVTSCASKCSNQGCAYIGLEFSFQCWCDNTLDPRAIPVDPSNCDMACCADNSVACGGNWFIGIYASNATNNSALAPTQTPSVTSYSGNNSNATNYGSEISHTNNNSNIATSHGSDTSQTSNNIALGTGIGIGVPGVILSAVLVMMKLSRKCPNPEQNAFQQSSEISSTRNLYAESAQSK